MALTLAMSGPNVRKGYFTSCIFHCINVFIFQFWYGVIGTIHIMFIQLGGKQDYKVLYNLAMAHGVCLKLHGNMDVLVSFKCDLNANLN
jgi:hypothetical protein